jgi:hypothetical protein
LGGCAKLRTAISTAQGKSIHALKMGASLEFRVMWEIDIDAGSPAQAAREARAVQLRPDTTATLFHVWEHAGKMHQIDLAGEVGSFQSAELVAVKTGLRFLRRAPGVPASIQDVASVMLTYLEEGGQIVSPAILPA